MLSYQICFQNLSAFHLLPITVAVIMYIPTESSIRLRSMLLYSLVFIILGGWDGIIYIGFHSFMS